MYRLLLVRWVADLILGIFLLVFFLDLNGRDIHREALLDSTWAIRDALQWYSTMLIPVVLWPLDLACFFDSIRLSRRDALSGTTKTGSKARLLGRLQS